jgi:hypothetical protein
MRSAAVAATLAVTVLLLGWGRFIAPVAARYDPQDQWQGLPADKGREEVYYNCVPCHSTAIIQQQRLRRRVWDDVLDSMVEQMGMPELAKEDRKIIIDYLAKHFGQDAAR